MIKVLSPKGFLPEVARELAGSKSWVVFPTRRAKLYFWYYLHRLYPKAQLPPKTFSFADFLDELAVRLDPRPVLPRADQAWLLWQLVRKRPPFAQVAQNFDRFFPWGLRLAEVLDQLEKEMVKARNLPYPPEEELPQEARIFLKHLGELQEDFSKALEARGVTTPGRRLRLLAENADQLDIPAPLHLVGFFVLTRAEEVLFKAWLQKGAVLWWRAEGKDLPPVLQRQRRFFQVEIQFQEAPPNQPSFQFYEAPDVHHELAALKGLLPKEIKAPDEALILLCAAGHLIPLLYELPDDLTVNVTLGYPLFRTALAHLFLLFMETALSRQGQRLHIPTYLRLLKHPYIRGLKLPSGQELAPLFQILEERLRHRGSPYLTPKEIQELLSLESTPSAHKSIHEGAKILGWFHQEILDLWLNVSSPETLAQAIRRTLKFVLAPREKILRNLDTPEVLVERALLYALETEVLPALEKVSFAQEPLKPSTLFGFLRDLLRNVRAPFEGEPLEGLQVMGLLETRLLSFRRIFVLDANEGYLPSVEEINPLLPEGVKPLLGLPTRDREEVIERYHFFTLIQGAEEVHIFYQSAVSGKGETVGKKMRSRYVEALLWEEEKRAGKLLPEKVSSIPLVLDERAWHRPEGIPKGQAERAAVEEILFSRDKVSATLFNTYLECPAKFYFRYVLGLKPAQEVASFDAAELGETVHQALEEYFSPYKGRVYLPVKHNDPQRLRDLFLARFKQSALFHRLGPERRFFVEETAIFRLNRYLNSLKEKYPQGFTLLDLEKEFRKTWQGLSLYGRLDRLEKRGQVLYVLDYKTGSYVKSLSFRHLEEKLLPYDPPHCFGAEELFDFQSRLPDVQLFLYLFLTLEMGAQNAVYLQLAAGNVRDLEKPLFPETYVHNGTGIQFVQERFPKLLTYLVEHMLKAKAFYGTREGKICKFCDFKLCCECAKW